MSVKSQQNNMDKLCDLLGQNLSFIWGEHESGPNGAKKTFLHVGRVFLRALAKDLGLRDAVVGAEAGGIGVSGSCHLLGMWETHGIYISIRQYGGSKKNVILYRTIRNRRDHCGGYNHFIRMSELESMRYEDLLELLASLRKDYAYGRVA